MFCFKRVPSLMVRLSVIFLLVNPISAKSTDLSKNPANKCKYQSLLGSLDAAARTTDFIAFTDFATDNEQEDRNASLEYLTSRPDLIERIRDDLGSKEVHWQLEGLSSRLLYVPEGRKEVAGLFTDYCREIIADLVDRTGLSNPYSSISIQGDNASTETTEDRGIKAIIVQDLAREYVARYQFSGNSAKKIKISLSGRQTINEVGSFSSYLQYPEKNGDWQFLRDQQTVWKSVSDNPYTVLMTPLEETLHIALRQYTEKAILAAIIAKQVTPSAKEVEEVVEEWLAVEEAIVGGLVYSLVPDVVLGRIPDLPLEWIQADLDTKAQFHKYRFLPRAIKMVQGQGLKKSILLYEQDPVAARRSLLDESS